MSPTIAYGDTVLYPADIASLANPEFVTDSVISLCLEVFNEQCNKVYSISPSVIQLMKMTPSSQLKEMFSALELPNFDIILCPVNDSDSVTSQMSGQHWSLLCYVKKEGIVYHIDSANSFNAGSAKLITDKLSALLSASLKCRNLCCAQQNNGYDCGVFVIYFCEQIFKFFKSNKCFDSKIVQSSLPRNYRSDLLADIKAVART